MDINWYPGHMAKTKRLIKEKESLIDIVEREADIHINTYNSNDLF